MGKKKDRCVEEGKSKTRKLRKIVRSKDKRPIIGMETRRLYYDSSLLPDIHSIRMDKLVCFTELAIRVYNIKEGTQFGQVKMLKAVATLFEFIDFGITFQAFSPLGVATLFTTEVRQFIGKDRKFEIRFVRIKRSHSSCKNSRQDLPCNDVHEQRLSEGIRTLSIDSVNDLGHLAPYLSQLALVLYNYFTLHLTKDAVHDITSVKIVKAIKHVAEGTTYLVTFEASLREESKNVETFETQICMPTLFSPTTIEFQKIQIKHECD